MAASLQQLMFQIGKYLEIGRGVGPEEGRVCGRALVGIMP